MMAAEDTITPLTILTSDGRVTLSGKVLQLHSPLIRGMMASMPVSGPAQEPLTVSLPDASSATVDHFYKLLMKGKISEIGITENIRDVKKNVASLAETLGFGLNIDQARLDDPVDDMLSHGSLRVRKFEEMATPTLADQTDEEDCGLGGLKDVATNSGKLKIRNIEDLLTQENGMEVGEGENEIVSEEECLEEGAQAFPSKTEQGEWQCPLCYSKFNRKRIFWCHNENVHKRFTCSCKKQFTSRDQLEDHIKRVHEGQLGQEAKCENVSLKAGERAKRRTKRRAEWAMRRENLDLDNFND